jgi:hypothetical protein
VEATGLILTTKFAKTGLPDNELAAEFHRVQQLLGKMPTRSEFAAHGQLSPGVYERRFGRWTKVIEHYGGPPVARPPTKPTATQPSAQVKPDYIVTQKGKREFGPPLNFRELRHEPVNEQGVVYAFGMIARELGLLVEAIGTGYPDCVAKRPIKGGGYVPVNIEFEFKSSNFREHGHDPQQCDLLVCWEHNWTECPVEVLELKSALRKLGANG